MAKRKAVIKDIVAVEDVSVKATVKESAPAQDPMYDDIEVQVDGFYRIAGQDIKPGKNIIKRHQLDTLNELVYRKRYSDARVTQGKNYLTEKLAGNVLVIKEVDRL